jgi:hypothetical protein
MIVRGYVPSRVVPGKLREECGGEGVGELWGRYGRVGGGGAGGRKGGVGVESPT